MFYKDLKERAEWAEEGGKVPSLKQSGLELEHNGNQVHRNVNIIITIIKTVIIITTLSVIVSRQT